MAMRKTDKPTPGTGAPQRKYNTVGPARTPSKTPLGRRPTKPVVKVQPKGAVKKSVVKNPSAPKPVGSGAKDSVKVMTKTESMLKKGNVKPDKSNAKNATPPGRNRSMTSQEKYKRPGTQQKMIDNMQGFRGRSPRGARGGMGGGGLFGGGAIRKSK